MTEPPQGERVCSLCSVEPREPFQPDLAVHSALVLTRSSTQGHIGRQVKLFVEATRILPWCSARAYHSFSGQLKSTEVIVRIGNWRLTGPVCCFASCARSRLAAIILLWSSILRRLSIAVLLYPPCTIGILSGGGFPRVFSSAGDWTRNVLCFRFGIYQSLTLTTA